MDVSLTQTIANVTGALTPAFACGFAVQQALQIIDPLIKTEGNVKRAIMGMISLIMGLVIAGFGNLGILSTLLKAAGGTTQIERWIDILVGSLVISAGTEGFNSIMKFLTYQKESAKSEAAVKKAAAASTQVPQSNGALSLVNG
jgi:hypothetical protein